LADYLQVRYRQDGAEIPQRAPEGPYPYNPHDSEAQQLMREQQFVEEMMSRGTPNFRAMPPWETTP